MSESDHRPECPLPTDIFVPRDEVEPNDYNPNYMDQDTKETLVQSILDNTWTQPIVMNAATGVIIDGEQRWRASGDPQVQNAENITPEGVPAGHVPIVAIEHSEGDARIATIQHNTRGETDYMDLGDMMADLDAMDMADEAQDRLGFSNEEMDRLIEDVTAPEDVGGDVDDFSVPWEPTDRTDVDEDEFDDEHRSDAVRESGEAGEEGEDGEASEGDVDHDVGGGTDTSVDPSDYQRMSFVVSGAEREVIETALGEDQAAQTMINLCQWAIDNDLLPQVRPDMNEEAAEELDDDELEELREQAAEQTEEADDDD